MVLRHVEHRCGIGLEARDPGAAALELEAGQLQHPYLGQLVLCQRGGQRVQQRRTDVAGQAHALAGALDEQRRHRGGRRLAVGAGDGEQLGRVAARVLQLDERTHEEVELASHRDVVHPCFLRERSDARVVGREAGALEHERHALERGLGLQLAAEQFGCGQFAAQRLGLRRHLARVPDAHAGPGARAPARHGQAALAETEDEDDVAVRHALALTAISGWPAR